MSFTTYILLAGFWAFAVWGVSVFCAKLFKPLSAWPEYWLVIVGIAFGTPILAWTLLGIGVVPPDIFAVFPKFEEIQIIGGADTNAILPHIINNLVWSIYGLGVGIRLVQILMGWLQLYRAASGGQQEMQCGQMVIVTDNTVPLCAFGVFRPKILCPKNLIDETASGVDLKTRSLLLAHEAAHIRNFDPLVMVCLLLIKAVFWPHPAIYGLVKRWQLAAELRADNAALAGENIDIRKKYGQILVRLLRHSDVKNGKGTPPCPSATLNLSNYRSAKMRVKNILDENINLRKTKQKPISL